MSAKRTPRKRRADAATRQVSQRATPGLLEQRPLVLDRDTPLPSVQLRSVPHGPLVYRKMIDQADSTAQPGDLVRVIHRDGANCGFGLFNPRSEIVLRLLSRQTQVPDTAFWQQRLKQAISLRQELLRLDAVTDAYRMVHAEADGLSGLVVDRYGDVLSAQVYSLGMFQRGQALMEELARLCGTSHALVSVDAAVHGQEGFLAEPWQSPGFPRQATIQEFGTRFRVDFSDGHKTGYFCDQRENRRQLATFCRDCSVLDVCCYTGGFAVQASRLGHAREVTAVDLDETAIALARENAAINKTPVRFVHADAFAYMRDMLRNGRQYDVVVLDPPKLIRNRQERDEGTRKHFDLNRLAMQLVAPGGLLLSCSCSGLLDETAFLRLLHSAARQATDSHPGQTQSTAEADSSRQAGRELQILAKTGAAADHPVAPNCPQTEYLRAVWMRLL